MSQHSTKHIIEAALLTAGKPLTLLQLQTLLSDDETPLDKQFVLAALDALADDFEGRGVEIRLVASGYRLQVKQEFEPWVARLFEERPPRYSRALLETLALIAYRQPITRAEIEDVRGVSVSSNIVKTLLEREWIKVVGQRDVPGRPSMYGTTKMFLDYFNIKAVSELPPLDELLDLDTIDNQLDMLDPNAAAALAEAEANAENDEAQAASEDGTLAEANEQDGVGSEPAENEAAEGLDATEGDEPAADVADETAAVVDGQASDAADDDGTVLDFPASAETDITGSDTTVLESTVVQEGGDSLGTGGGESGDTADIDSLVNMLDEMDAAGDETVLSSTEDDDTKQNAELPSTLAQNGETAAAVEAARLALADQAVHALERISDREPDQSPSGAVDAKKAEPGEEGSELDSTAWVDTTRVELSDHAADNLLENDKTSLDETVLDDTVAETENPDEAGDDTLAKDADATSAPHDANIAALIDADNRNHEAARGEPITPADSLRRSSSDTPD